MGQEIAETHLVKELVALDCGLSITDMRVSGLRSSVPAELRLPTGRISKLPYGAQLGVGRIAYRRADLVHRFDLRLPPGRREVLTVHDIAPLRFSDEGDFPRGAAQAIKRAAAVVCPSQFSANEVRDYFGRQDVHVIPNGVGSEFFNAVPLRPEELVALGLPERWLLHTGGATTRKNLQNLIGAWRLIESEHPDVSLVMCGPPDPRRTSLCRDVPRTILLGRVERELIPRLMASATAVVVPSLYEGFGLPALEAMATGAPLVVSNSGSLPEVAGLGALLVEPTVDGLAGGLTGAISGVSEFRREASLSLAASRTWKAAARSYIEVYHALLSG